MLCPICEVKEADCSIKAPRGWAESGPVYTYECCECAARDGFPWYVDGRVVAPGLEPVAYKNWNPTPEQVAVLASELRNR